MGSYRAFPVIGRGQLAALLLALPAGVAMAQSAPDDARFRQDYERRLQTEQVLRDALKRDAAASGKNVDAALAVAGDAEGRAAKLAGAANYQGALQALDPAYQELRRALMGIKAGSSPNLPSGSAALDTTRLSGPEKIKAEVEQRLRSARVLRDALQRFDAQGNAATLAGADRDLADAERLLAAGDPVAAREASERAYRTIKQASVTQRDHTEQVAAKKFASPREEYAYELGRNDDYARFGKAVEQRGEVSGTSRTALDKAAALRRAAEAAASEERWADGVKALEAATIEYKRVVREAGFNVP